MRRGRCAVIYRDSDGLYFANFSYQRSEAVKFSARAEAREFLNRALAVAIVKRYPQFFAGCRVVPDQGPGKRRAPESVRHAVRDAVRRLGLDGADRREL